MQIPRIIHQTWKDEDVPESFQELALSWRQHHPDWEYRFWTDESNRAFIRDHFPYFLDRYDHYLTNIERVDAVRYFILYRYGGVYIDLDFECLANISGLLTDARCIFGKEPVEHCLIHGKEMIISNAFMGAIPHSVFFNSICEQLGKDRPLVEHPNNRVLETTGPFMLTNLYNDHPKKEEITLLEPSIIYPLTKEELSRMADGEMPGRVMEEKLRNAYGIHHYAGTWWKKENPFQITKYLLHD